MVNRKLGTTVILLVLFLVAALPAAAQSFRVQCPTSTITHPVADNNNSEPPYTGPTYTGTQVYSTSGAGHVNGAIKCQQISGGDGYATMGDGTQTYMFSFGPLSGLAAMANGQPGTGFPSDFNTTYSGPRLQPGDPATSDNGGPGLGAGCGFGSPCPTSPFGYNGAVGLTSRVVDLVNIYDASEGTGPTGPAGATVTIVANAPLVVKIGDPVLITNLGAGYDGTWIVSAVNIANPFLPSNYAFQYVACTNLTTTPYSGCTTGLGELTAPFTGPAPSASTLPVVDGHVDPRPIMDVAVMNGNIPAPLMAFDEDDEFFLTLTNVGMIMRPDLFEQHTVHFHGYPNASALFDGVPDASVAINIGGSFTYYYLAPDAGTYFWHCHITPPEHLQMGMVGQLYVRPRQDRVSGLLYDSLQTQQKDLRTACRRSGDGGPGTVTTTDILCSNPVPAVNTGATGAATVESGGTSGYAYNDGDGSTYYDVEYPIQMHGFDPTFHFVGMTFNPEGFADMKDKYFLINGRSYPDTVTPGPLATMSTDGALHYSQPLPSIISIPAGKRALLRISDLNVSEYHTLASLGIPMQVIALNAKLLRDQAGNNLYYTTNSITMAGGESLDVILDSCGARDATFACLNPIPNGTYYLYTPNLDHLSNDAENFGGMMTEVRIN
jgi:FtsP/CotA-like multicopper oxidase with cupredoxin domain